MEDSSSDEGFSMQGGGVQAFQSPTVHTAVSPVFQGSDTVDRAVNLAIESLFRSYRPAMRTPTFWESLISPPLVSPLDLIATNRSVLILPPIPVPAQTAMRLNMGSQLTSVVRRIFRVPWPVQQSGKRHKALLAWRLIIEENLSATSLGRQLQKLVEELKPDEHITESIEYAFDGKSISTLSKRASSMLKFILWHRRNMGISGLPLIESKVFEYIKELKDHAAPTAPSSFMSALNFSRYTLDMEGAREVTDSARIRGVASSAKRKKRPKKQKRNLKVDEVATLECQAQTSKCPFDTYACLYFLAQAFTRSRYMGLCMAAKVLEDFDSDDDGFVEFPTLHSKTQSTADLATTFLPLVAPAIGITGFKWGREFVNQRKSQGLDRLTYLLPVPSSTGVWIDEPLAVGQAGKWLRDLLRQGGHTDVEDVGTHSLKATPLSWAAKFNSPLEIRALLGYHAARELTSVLSYSRDAQSGPLAELNTIMSAIRNKTFFPDLTRSGRLVSNVHKHDAGSIPRAKSSSSTHNSNTEHAVDTNSTLLKQFEVEDPYPESAGIEQVDVEPFVELQGSDSDSSSSSSESSLDEAAVAPLRKVSLKPPLAMEGFVPYVHKLSAIMHIKSFDIARLRCGRMLSLTYTKFDWEDTAGFLKCGQCFP